MHPLIVVIQARVGSTRLRNKVLMEIEGIPVFARVCMAALEADVGPTVLAIPDTPENDVMADVGEDIRTARGPEHNVAERFLPVVRDTDAFVRLCADSPFMDKITIRNAVQTYNNSDASVCIGGDHGRRVQVVRTASWLKAFKRMNLKEKEHVVPPWLRPRIEAAPLTLDTWDDYCRLKLLT